MPLFGYCIYASLYTVSLQASRVQDRKLVSFHNSPPEFLIIANENDFPQANVNLDDENNDAPLPKRSYLIMFNKRVNFIARKLNVSKILDPRANTRLAQRMKFSNPAGLESDEPPAFVANTAPLK